MATSLSGRALSKRGTLRIYRIAFYSFGLMIVMPIIRLKLPPERRSTWKVLDDAWPVVRDEIVLRRRSAKRLPRRRSRVKFLAGFGHNVKHSCSTSGLKSSKGSW